MILSQQLNSAKSSRTENRTQLAEPRPPADVEGKPVLAAPCSKPARFCFTRYSKPDAGPRSPQVPTAVSPLGTGREPSSALCPPPRAAASRRDPGREQHPALNPFKFRVNRAKQNRCSRVSALAIILSPLKDDYRNPCN